MANTARDLQVSALKRHDLEDLLEHIAWEEILLPRIEQAKSLLTQQLVESTLQAPRPGAPTREQIAGKLFGIQWITGEIARVLAEGRGAEKFLSE